jgi:hypothetical protein
MLLVFVPCLLIWESIARFYLSPFHLQTGLPFALLFYPCAVLGVLMGGFFLPFGSRPKIEKSTNG